jgi:MFS family permease
MLPGGWFIDRSGVRVALGMMALLTSLCGVLTGMGREPSPAGGLLLYLIVVRSFMGLLHVPLHPASARAVGIWVPGENQTRANGSSREPRHLEWLARPWSSAR